MKFVLLLVGAGLVCFLAYKHFSTPGESSFRPLEPGERVSENFGELTPETAPPRVMRSEEPATVSRYRFQNRSVPSSTVLEEFTGEDTRLVVDPATNSVVWRGAPDLGLVLNGLDQQPDTAVLEVVFVLVRLSSGENFGTEWAISPVVPTQVSSIAGSGGVLSLDAGSFALGLQHRASQGRLEVVSRPSVMLIEGEESEIASGREIPTLTTESQLGTVNQGVTFRPVELAVSASFVKLQQHNLTLSFNNSDVGRSVQLANAEVPEVVTQRVKTRLVADPGRWYAAGSVIVDTSERGRDGLLTMLVGGSRSRELLRSEIGVFVRLVGQGDDSPSPPLPEPPDELRALPAILVESEADRTVPEPAGRPWWKPNVRLPRINLGTRPRPDNRPGPPHRR